MAFRILLSFLLLSISASAGNISGIVTDQAGEPIPFVNVFISGTITGSTTNLDGFYSLETTRAELEVVFKYIGYKTLVKQIVLQNGQARVDVQMLQEEYRLAEVVVSGEEDPAYAIIRKAIKKRKYHYNLVKGYECDVYLKGLQELLSAPDKIFGFTVNFDGSLDSNNAGIVYLSESQSKFYFEKPDKVKEVMIASKVSGNSQTFSWNSASDFMVDFYKNSLDADFLSERVFFSPIAENAMLFYKYQLEGVFIEDGRMINKIKVIPKRKNDPVYRGWIYIVDELWNIHSADLMLVSAAGINFVDTLKIQQMQMPIDEKTWMPFSQKFEFGFKILGIKGEGYFLGVYDNYVLNPKFDKKFFSNEMLKIDEGSNKIPSWVWDTLRPAPLTENEVSDYDRKDSLEVLKESKAHLDTMDKTRNKFTGWDIITGYDYTNSFHEFDLQLNPILEQVSYNTAEGLALAANIKTRKKVDEKRTIRTETRLRYGFGNHHFNSMGKLYYYFKPHKFQRIGIEGGQYVFQFNGRKPISPLVNTIYTLFAEENHLKLQERLFIKGTYRYELFNGAMLSLGAEYGKRKSLNNISNYSFVDREKQTFSSNIPATSDSLPASVFVGNKKYTEISASLRLRFGQKYITRPNRKITMGTKWPELTFTYKKGLSGIGGSETNFDYFQVHLLHHLKFGLVGESHYNATAGIFPNSSNVMFKDYRHFNGNQTYIGTHYLGGFHLLKYYAFSTTDPFVEAHYEHHFNGFLFNKIPLIRKLKFQAVAGINFLYTEQSKTYFEVLAGIENIGRILRFDFVTSFNQGKKTETGIRIGIEFGG